MPLIHVQCPCGARVSAQSTYATWQALDAHIAYSRLQGDDWQAHAVTHAQVVERKP